MADYSNILHHSQVCAIEGERTHVRGSTLKKLPDKMSLWFSFLVFVGVCGVLRFLWYCFKIIFTYLSRPVNLKERGVDWVLITGASSGVGRSLSLLCAIQGINVIGIGRNVAALNEVQNLCRQSGSEFEPISVDLSSSNAVAEIFKLISEKPIGAMFICHGSRSVRRFSQFTEKELIDYNTAMMTNNILLAKHFSSKTSGTITYISSCHSFTFLPFNQNYGSVKRFLNHFVHHYQLETNDVTVQVLNPGRINGTHFFDDIPSHLKYLAKPVKLGLTPERVAEMVLATVYTNFDVDVGWDSILTRMTFWIVPDFVLRFVLRTVAVHSKVD